MSFAGAPVSKGIIIALGAISLLAAASSRQYLFDVPLTPHLTRDHQIWRLFVHHLAFTNSSELFVGILVLFYTSNPIERTFGSIKYASFLIAITLLTTILETISLILFNRIGFKLIPAGPFSIIAAIVYQSFRLTPTTFYWKVFGYEISNRVTFYLLTAQLFASQPPTTLYLTLLGILSSSLYRANFLSLRTYRISPRLILLIIRLFRPLLGNPIAPRRSTIASHADTINSLGMSGGLARAALGPMPVTPATTATVTTPTMAVVVAPGVGVVVPRSTTTPRTSSIGSRSHLVREWTDGITAGGGVRQPTAQQIAELSAIFPETSRDVILAALQRNPDVGRAAETLLGAPP